MLEAKDLRNVGAGVGLGVVIVAGSRVEMAVGNRQVSADISADPVCDVLLVHGVLVRLILARSRAVQVARLGVKLHAERELRFAAHATVWVGRVSELEAACDGVGVGSDSVLVVSTLVRSLRSSKTHSVVVLAEFVVLLRHVGPRAGGVLVGSSGGLSLSNDLEGGNRVCGIGLVVVRAGHTIAVVLGVANFAAEHRLRELRLAGQGFVLTGTRVHVTGHLVIAFSVHWEGGFRSSMFGITHVFIFENCVLMVVRSGARVALAVCEFAIRALPGAILVALRRPQVLLDATFLLVGSGSRNAGLFSAEMAGHLVLELGGLRAHLDSKTILRRH